MPSALQWDVVPSTPQQIEAVARECRRMVSRRALLAAGVAVVPIPGLDWATNVGVLVKVLPDINKAFGLSAEQIERLAPDRRVVVFKAGKTALGARATASHSAPLAGDYAVARACLQAAGADQVADLGARLHDVGRDSAGIEIGVVDPRVGGHVLAHVVHADIHQLARIERRAAEMRRRGGMRRSAMEGEVDAGIGEG